MKVAYRVIFVVGTLYVLLNLFSYITPEAISTMLAGFLLIALVAAVFATAIRGFYKWRISDRFWMGPSLVALGFALTTWPVPPVGRLVADTRFRHHVTEYEEVVNRLRLDTNLASSPTATKLSVVNADGLPSSVRTVIAARCGQSTLVAAFLIDTSVPLLHEGYIYEGYADSDHCVVPTMRPENRWPYVRHVFGTWYHFSDQPGL